MLQARILRLSNVNPSARLGMLCEEFTAGRNSSEGRSERLQCTTLSVDTCKMNRQSVCVAKAANAVTAPHANWCIVDAPDCAIYCAMLRRKVAAGATAACNNREGRGQHTFQSGTKRFRYEKSFCLSSVQGSRW
jgi:hypothetical protein